MTALLCELSVVRPEDAEDSTVLILREARCLFAQAPSWLAFYRALLGTEGLIAATFTAEERAAFEHSLAYAEVQTMLGELRRARWDRQDFEPVEKRRLVAIFGADAPSRSRSHF